MQLNEGPWGYPMQMLLMVACMSLFGMAVACLAFGVALRGDSRRSNGKHNRSGENVDENSKE